MDPIVVIIIIILLLSWIIAAGFVTDANVHLTSYKNDVGNAYIYTLAIAITTWTIIGLTIIFAIFFNEEIFLVAKRQSLSKYFIIFSLFLVVANLSITVISAMSLEIIEKAENNLSKKDYSRIKFDLILSTVLSLAGLVFLLIYFIIKLIKNIQEKKKYMENLKNLEILQTQEGTGKT
jgi:hypothetical protein